jgi:hypothetical protein
MIITNPLKRSMDSIRAEGVFKDTVMVDGLDNTPIVVGFRWKKNIPFVFGLEAIGNSLNYNW